MQRASWLFAGTKKLFVVGSQAVSACVLMNYFCSMEINMADQLGVNILLDKTPSKIISLVPSQTELLHSLGLESEVIGITKFCIYPNEWFRSKQRVGGTKTVNINLIRSLQPDIIFANKEENVKEQIDALREICPVYVSDICTLSDALKMIADVGKLTGKETAAANMSAQIFGDFQQLRPDTTYNTAYLIWQEPYMVAGGDTFISDMMYYAGFRNIYQQHSRYPETTIKQLQAMNCELLLLSSEPFPFEQKHIDILQPLLPNTKILLADGEMFSWYGSRLMKAAAYFRELKS